MHKSNMYMYINLYNLNKFFSSFTFLEVKLYLVKIFDYLETCLKHFKKMLEWKNAIIFYQTSISSDTVMFPLYADFQCVHILTCLPLET